MARAIRIEYPGAFYHVFSRGNERREIFRTESDYRAFLRRMGETCETFGFRCHAFVLMSNHYHLLLETPNGELSAGMQYLNGTYSQEFNRRNNRVGHVFQGRFKALLVEAESYLLTLSRYIHQNPSNARLVEHPWDYQWSSCRQFLSLDRGVPWVSTTLTLERFGPDCQGRLEAYANFVAGPTATDPIADAAGQVILGSAEFAERMRARAREAVGDDPELSKRRSAPSVPAVLAAIARVVGRPVCFERGRRGASSERRLALYLLRELSRLSLQEVSRLSGLGRSTVSEAAISFSGDMASNPSLRGVVRAVKDALGKDVRKPEV